MEHYVNIMLDGGFKAVFGDKQVAMDFINAALEGEHKVMDITYLDKELVPELIDERTVIFDLLCEDEDGSKFILEMQNCPQRYFFNRGFYYICRMISRQGETPLEKTIYVLKNMNLFDMSPFKEKEAYFRRLLDVANVNALSPKERATYDENLKIYRDWKATMEYAVEEAETKGKAEGERLATLRNARNMKKAGVALSLVAECTGLSLEIIQSL